MSLYQQLCDLDAAWTRAVSQRLQFLHAGRWLLASVLLLYVHFRYIQLLSIPELYQDVAWYVNSFMVLLLMVKVSLCLFTARFSIFLAIFVVIICVFFTAPFKLIHKSEFQRKPSYEDFSILRRH